MTDNVPSKLDQLLEEYYQFANIFSEQKTKLLLEYCSYNLSI